MTYLEHTWAIIVFNWFDSILICAGSVHLLTISGLSCQWFPGVHEFISLLLLYTSSPILVNPSVFRLHDFHSMFMQYKRVYHILRWDVYWYMIECYHDWVSSMVITFHNLNLYTPPVSSVWDQHHGSWLKNTTDVIWKWNKETIFYNIFKSWLD